MKRSRKYAIAIAVAAFLLVLDVLALLVIIYGLVVWSRDDLRAPQAAAIAQEDFGIQKIFFAAYGTTDSFLLNENVKFSHGIWYVLGMRADEEVFVIVPTSAEEAPYQAEWPFSMTFSEMVVRMNEVAGEEAITVECFPDDRFAFHIYDIDSEMERLALAGEFEAPPDFPFVIRYFAEKVVFYVYEAGGEVHISACDEAA